MSGACTLSKPEGEFKDLITANENVFQSCKAFLQLNNAEKETLKCNVPMGDKVCFSGNTFKTQREVESDPEARGERQILAKPW